jgi:hypothetical protein
MYWLLKMPVALLTVPSFHPVGQYVLSVVVWLW